MNNVFGSLSTAATALRALVLGCALGFHLQGAFADPAPATEDADAVTVRSYPATLKQAFEHISHNETATGYALLAEAIRDPEFSELADEGQHAVLKVAGLAALELEKWSEARTYLDRATSSRFADGGDWAGLAHAAWRTDDRRLTALALARTAQLSPKELEQFNSRFIYHIASSAKNQPETRAIAFELMDALFAANWQLDDGSQPSGLWYELALANLDQGKSAAVRKIVERIDTVSDLIAIRVDKRFDDIRRKQPRRFDIPAAVGKEIERLHAVVQSRPRSLDALVQYAYALNRVQRFEETLRLMDEALMKVKASKDSSAFDDIDDSYVWALDLRAQALRGLQRFDEAERVYLQALPQNEQGNANVSQVINLAEFYIEQGRPDDAIATLRQAGKLMSDYGWMQYHNARYRASMQRPSEAAAARESIEYLATHWKDAPDAYLGALLDAGQDDATAAFLIQRLRDPDTRRSALMAVQQYNDPPATAVVNQRRERFRALLARSDVAAAIKDVGRIERFDISRPGS